MTAGRISPRIGKTDALVELAARAGIGEVDPYASDLSPLFGALIAALRPDANADVAFVESSAGERVTHFRGLGRSLASPEFRNGRPTCFPATSGVQESPAFVVAEIPGGILANIARAAIAFRPDGRTVVTDHSSRYAPLLQFYDVEAAGIVREARAVAGDVLVLCDDIFPLNYSHFLADTLPRLACLGGRRDVTLAMSDQDAPFVREALQACGFAEDRIVRFDDFSAIRAERLLIPRDCHAMPHPAYKAAAWALDFLRSRMGLGPKASLSRKIYVSRADAVGRRILNEDALLRVLTPAGYVPVTLAGRSVAEQAALFAGATHIAGLHGAGLTNVVFAPPGARLLEIFPASYGTPAFYLLAAGGFVEYASYVAHDVRAGSREQVDDVAVDAADFERCCRDLL